MRTAITQRFHKMGEYCSPLEEVLPVAIVGCLGWLGSRIDIHSWVVHEEVHSIGLAAADGSHGNVYDNEKGRRKRMWQSVPNTSLSQLDIATPKAP